LALALFTAAGPAKADPLFMRTSLPPGEAQRSMDEFRARESDPDAARMLRVFGCLTAVGGQRYEAAQRDCSDAILLDPGNPGPYKLRGEASLFQGHFAAALADFDKAVALDATDPENFAARGEAFRLMGRFRPAIGDFDRAIALSPRDPRFWNSRCWVRAEANRELAKALADCNRAHGLSHRFSAALDSRGVVYLRLHRYVQAIKDYDGAINLRSDFPSALFGRGLAKLHLRQTAGGRGDIRKARTLDPGIDSFFARMGITGQGLAMPALKRRQVRPERQAPARKSEVADRQAAAAPQ
jgi:tetratricopeptide (TPR) repeat protein